MKEVSGAERNGPLTADQQAELAKDSLGEKLQAIICNLPEDKLTLSEIRDLLGRDGMLLFTSLLTLVFLIPISIPGISTIFGGAILLIGVCLLFGWNLWLPKRFLKREFPAETLRNNLTRGLKWFNRLEKISRPRRLMCLTGNRAAGLVNFCSIIVGAVLLMMPFGLIPFSNTLPAIAILFYSIGILHKDGISLLLGHLSILATIIYFTTLITGSGLILYELYSLFA